MPLFFVRLPVSTQYCGEAFAIVEAETMPEAVIRAEQVYPGTRYDYPSGGADCELTMTDGISQVLLVLE